MKKKKKVSLILINLKFWDSNVPQFPSLITLYMFHLFIFVCKHMHMMTHVRGVPVGVSDPLLIWDPTD